MRSKIAEDAWIRLKNDGERVGVEGTRNKIYPRNLSSLSVFSRHSARVISASLSLTTARTQVFRVWQRREVYADGFAILHAARNNLHNCAGPLQLRFLRRGSLFNES